MKIVKVNIDKKNEKKEKVLQPAETMGCGSGRWAK